MWGLAIADAVSVVGKEEILHRDALNFKGDERIVFRTPTSRNAAVGRIFECLRCPSNPDLPSDIYPQSLPVYISSRCPDRGHDADAS